MNNEIVAKRLVELRGDRSQRDVAEVLGITQAAYAMYETGKRTPRDDKKEKLANYYGVSVASLFYS